MQANPYQPARCPREQASRLRGGVSLGRVAHGYSFSIAACICLALGLAAGIWTRRGLGAEIGLVVADHAPVGCLDFNMSGWLRAARCVAPLVFVFPTQGPNAWQPTPAKRTRSSSAPAFSSRFGPPTRNSAGPRIVH